MTTQESGYMYCCDVQELRANISYVPDLCREDGQCPKLMSDTDSTEEAEEADFVPPQDSCPINLDSRSGDHPPLLIQDGEIRYPTRKNADGKRVIYIGKTKKMNILV